MSFYEAFYEKIASQIDLFKSEIDRSIPANPEHYMWENILFRMDRRNYNIEYIQNEGFFGLSLEPVIPEGSKIEHDIKSLPDNRGITVHGWCNNILEKKDQTSNTLDNWRYFFELSKSLSGTGYEDSPEEYFNCPCSIAYIAATYYWDNIEQHQRDWCIGIVITTSEDFLEDERNKRSNLLRSGLRALSDTKPCLSMLGLISVLNNVAISFKVRSVRILTGLLHYISISDNTKTGQFEILSKSLWVNNPDIARQCFRSFILLGMQDVEIEQAIAKCNDKLFPILSTFEFWDQVESEMYIDKAFCLIVQNEKVDTEELTFISAYLKALLERTFGKNVRKRNSPHFTSRYYEGENRFKEKFASIVLRQVDVEHAKKLFGELLSIFLLKETVELTYLSNDSIEFASSILRNIILYEDNENHTERFHLLWKILLQETFSSRRTIFLDYLLLNIKWKDEAQNWNEVDLYPAFYANVIGSAGGYDKLSSIKLIAGIGFNGLFYESLDLIMRLLSNDFQNKFWLAGYDAEKFIQRAFFYRGAEIRNDKKLRENFLFILDQMKIMGSSIAFIIKENMLSVSLTITNS